MNDYPLIRKLAWTQIATLAGGLALFMVLNAVLYKAEADAANHKNEDSNRDYQFVSLNSRDNVFRARSGPHAARRRGRRDGAGSSCSFVQATRG